MTDERLDDLALEDVDTLIEIIIAVEAERDKLREALEDISAEGRHARSGGTAYRMAVIARKALQEAEG